VESAFKAFSRSLRNLLDGTTTTASNGEESSSDFEALWGVQSDSYKQGMELNRTASISRKTKETSIDVALQLDWMHNGVSVSTGLSTLDKIFTKLAQEAKISLSVKCSGDTWVDDHHTTEDVGIAIGQCLNKALGTKAGLNRMWCASASSGDATVEVTMDLSNRPCLTHNLALAVNVAGEEYVGGDGCDLSVEMLVHLGRLSSFALLWILGGLGRRPVARGPYPSNKGAQKQLSNEKKSD
jgi:imidazoleglycerol phosphate dehydratase HisB